MNRAPPQQARGFEFFSQQPQERQQVQSSGQAGIGFQPAAPVNQYIGGPRVSQQSQMPGQVLQNNVYATEQSQYNDGRRLAAGTEADSLKKELEKSRAQIAQLEKTLKWWSDCTANWREKWSKEKAERRKLKEELSQVRSSFDQTLARELEHMKREFGEVRCSDGEGGEKKVGTSTTTKTTTTGVGTGDTLKNNAPLGNDGPLPIQIESTANFELQELLTETSSALEQERADNAELKIEIDRLTAEQTTLKTELNLLKETSGTLEHKDENGAAELSKSLALNGLPASVGQLIDNLQSKVDRLEKDVASRQTERLGDWSVIDRLEADRALLRAENERLTMKIEEIEKAIDLKAEGDDDVIEKFKTKEMESLRAEAQCLRRLVNRQTQELDHVNFLLSNQETETKLLRNRLLQPWGTSTQRSGSQTTYAPANSGGQV